MDEVVDIRAALQRPLVNFRAEMIKVTADLGLNSLRDDFDDAASELWFQRVAPALAELEEITRAAGLLRTYGCEAARGLSAPVGTALIVGLTSGNWTSGSLAGMANLGVTAATCASESRKEGRARQRQNPYYFLHSAERRLAG